ncbi:MAG: redoxin domain-containing protein [Halobacteriales archaeon]|nr:redoxin domain-containing protein [Halobacteriales archaeon]
MLSKGDTAPDFTAETTQGRFTLSEASSPVVLFFFPKAGSRVCTEEACSFRDSLAEFSGRNATVVGISTNDSLERLRDFAEEHDLDYPLASDKDTGGDLSDKYGLSGLLGLSQKAKRATFVVDDGEVVEVVKGLFSSDKHVEKSLEAVNEQP